jgi:hypothetical protein
MYIICAQRNNQFMKSYPTLYIVFISSLHTCDLWVNGTTLGPINLNFSTYVSKLSSDKSIKSTMKAAIREGI